LITEKIAEIGGEVIELNVRPLEWKLVTLIKNSNVHFWVERVEIPILGTSQQFNFGLLNMKIKIYKEAKHFAHYN
jgi:hypothetical protein